MAPKSSKIPTLKKPKVSQLWTHIKLKTQVTHVSILILKGKSAAHKQFQQNKTKMQQCESQSPSSESNTGAHSWCNPLGSTELGQTCLYSYDICSAHEEILPCFPVKHMTFHVSGVRFSSITADSLAPAWSAPFCPRGTQMVSLQWCWSIW